MQVNTVLGPWLSLSPLEADPETRYLCQWFIWALKGTHLGSGAVIPTERGSVNKWWIIEQVITQVEWNLLLLENSGKQCGACGSETSAPRGKRAGVFIHKLFSIINCGGFGGCWIPSTSGLLLRQEEVLQQSIVGTWSLQSPSAGRQWNDECTGRVLREAATSLMLNPKFKQNRPSQAGMIMSIFQVAQQGFKQKKCTSDLPRGPVWW
jgi:hypothetical protein